MHESEGADLPKGQVHDRDPREELYNSLTHFFGFGLSLAAAIALLPIAISQNSSAMVIACFIYCFSLMGVFLSSALSHLFSDTRKQQFFRRMDQSFIYLLIVASWTPFSLAFLQTTWWNVLLSFMWLCGGFGFVSKILMGHRLNRVSIWIYLLLGWTPVLGGLFVTPLMPGYIVSWILAGGICYTLGAVFLLNDKKSIWFHPIWHLLVLAGSSVHYFAILWYVV